MSSQTIGCMAPTITTLLTALVSLTLGAVLQHMRTGRAEARKQRDLLRASAYADFLRGVSLLAAAGRADPFPQQSIGEAMALVGDARARISIYGSEAMVRAMAEIAEFPRLTTRKACETFIRACRQMRIDAHASVSLTDDELSLVVLGHPLRNLPDEDSPSLAPAIASRGAMTTGAKKSKKSSRPSGRSP